MRIGAHVSTSGGVYNAPGNAAELGIKTIAVFVKNQRQWKAKGFSDDDIAKWFGEIEKHGIEDTVSHVSYLINLCAPDPEKLNKSLDALTDEVIRAEALGLSHVVIHPGSHLKEGEEWGLKTIASSLDEVHRRTEGSKAKICLEITAGQGTNLGYTFEQIGSIITQTEDSGRLSVCFDTCHAFAAGYSLQNEEDYESTWKNFNDAIGMEKLGVIHLNDSKNPLGSKKDRHEKIGRGEMGLEPFKLLVNDKRLKEIPAILETPESDGGYRTDLDTLYSLIES